MKYSRFEALMISLGAVVIVGSIFISPAPNPQWQEILGQALMLTVLAGAVHWGRDGGSVAAVAATLVYVVVRIPLLSAEGLSSTSVSMILTRMVSFGLVGILGGELFARIKYFFARLDGSAVVDETTNVYNRRYCGAALKNGLGQFQRYQAPFAVALVSLSPGLLTDLRPTRQRSMLRSVASAIRNDIRLVDDVGYLGDGRYLLILPQTPKIGAEVAADRVRRNVRDLLGAKDESVTATALAVPDDATAICDLARSLEPQAEPRLEDVCSTATE